MTRATKVQPDHGTFTKDRPFRSVPSPWISMNWGVPILVNTKVVEIANSNKQVKEIQPTGHSRLLVILETQRQAVQHRFPTSLGFRGPFRPLHLPGVQAESVLKGPVKP